MFDENGYVFIVQNKKTSTEKEQMKLIDKRKNILRRTIKKDRRKKNIKEKSKKRLAIKSLV